MNLIQSIIWHITKHRIISEITISLIGISVLLMAVISLYHIFANQEEYGKRMVWVGITVRILMIIAFTVEFYHHVSIYPLNSVQLSYKKLALDQLIYLLFYGYIVVVGLYQILTINISRYKGFFYAFDITMISIPLMHILTLIIYKFYRVITGQTENLSEVLLIMGIISIVFVSLYFFFRLYWKNNILNYTLFFATAISPIILLKFLDVYDLKYNPLFILQLFLILLVVYEGVRNIVLYLIAKKQVQLKRYAFLLAIFPLFLIITVNPIYNIWHLGINLGTLGIQETYHQGAPVTTLAEAQELAKIASGNYANKIMLINRVQENFHNGYRLQVGNYLVEISSIEGYLSNIHRQGKYNLAPESHLLSQEEVIRNSVEWLTNVGFYYQPTEIAIDIQEDEHVYNLTFKQKLSDGSIQTEKLRTADLSWYKDGTLRYFSGGANFPIVANPSQKILAGLDIKKLVDDWYSLLGEEAQPYIMQGGFTNRFPGRPQRLELEMKNKDRISIDKNGNIMSFIRGNSREAFHGSREEGIEIAKNYLGKIIPEQERGYFRLANEELYQESSGQYEFNYQKDEINTRYLYINLDASGKPSHISSGTSVRRDKYQTAADFPVSRQQAIKAVRKFYRPFEIYNQRVMLAAVADIEEIYSYRWMIVIFPFGKAEHHVYFVDVVTGEIDEIYGYKAGVEIE